jgi:hypothetical protein
VHTRRKLALAAAGALLVYTAFFPRRTKTEDEDPVAHPTNWSWDAWEAAGNRLPVDATMAFPKSIDEVLNDNLTPRHPWTQMYGIPHCPECFSTEIIEQAGAGRYCGGCGIPR